MFTAFIVVVSLLTGQGKIITSAALPDEQVCNDQLANNMDSMRPQLQQAFGENYILAGKCVPSPKDADNAS